MPYIATVALDYSAGNANAYSKLVTSLLQAGWEYSETSTVYVESDDLDAIRRGLALLAHGIDSPGPNTLSHLSVSVQFVGPAADPSYVKNHPRAIEQVTAMPVPF
ncbi:hypothetical protein ACFXP7_09725 [Microbacterium sp. P06]|uniref:hypothetical protein n=1 Tax=Microbacterium sp. P06 TaxID=3366949 RepID=UPI0037471A61